MELIFISSQHTVSYNPTMTFKYLLCLLGVFLAMPLLALIALACILPVTISGIGYLLACSLGVARLILAPWMRRHILLIMVGMLLLILIAGTRIIMGERSNVRMITLPQEKGTRWLSYIVDEQDGIIFGEAFFHLIGGDSRNEHENLSASLFAVYSEMRKDGDDFPSPVPATYLNLQQPKNFDAITIKPKDKPEFAVIFLHGFMGNVSSQCWVIAQPVKELGGMTICPSTDWQGEWWQPKGQAILQNTFDYLKAQGIQKIYVGGFSNGGFGLSRIATQFKDEKGLSGLFFIDGFANGASIKEIGLPVLIIQGTLDERVPPSVGRQFARELGDLGTYVEINSDHFLIMKQSNHVQKALAEWLEDH
jgi:pimeloyl-ACP methyl ester carboxylesterase